MHDSPAEMREDSFCTHQTWLIFASNKLGVVGMMKRMKFGGRESFVSIVGLSHLDFKEIEMEVLEWSEGLGL